MNLIELPISDIRVTRRREREELGDIDSLAISIAKFGQLQPIVVDENNELIAGERRLTARQQNGDLFILAIRKSDVDEILAKEMELEENLARKQMTWQEEARGLAELDRLRRMRDPNWTQVQTAVAAGGNTSQRKVSEAIKLTRMMEVFPELAEAKTLNKALKMAEQKAINIQRVETVRANPQDFADIESKIILGDSVDVIKTIPDGVFDAIITDPPFGVDYGDRAGDSASNASGYEDDKEKYERLLTMAPDMYRVLRPNAFCIWFLGISWYERCKHVFREAGFTVDEIPIIWDRSDGRTFTSRPDRWFGRAYDIALHMVKGEPRLTQSGKHNIIKVPPVPSSERDILVERPVELYQELIRRTTIEGEIVADFFVGGGGCPAAAASLRRGYFGVELSPERRAKGITKIKAYTPDSL